MTVFLVGVEFGWGVKASPTFSKTSESLRVFRSYSYVRALLCWLSSNCVAGAVGLGVLGCQQLTRMRIEWFMRLPSLTCAASGNSSAVLSRFGIDTDFSVYIIQTVVVTVNRDKPLTHANCPSNGDRYQFAVVSGFFVSVRRLCRKGLSGFRLALGNWRRFRGDSPECTDLTTF